MQKRTIVISNTGSNNQYITHKNYILNVIRLNNKKNSR